MATTNTFRPFLVKRCKNTFDVKKVNYRSSFSCSFTIKSIITYTVDNKLTKDLSSLGFHRYPRNFPSLWKWPGNWV